MSQLALQPSSASVLPSSHSSVLSLVPLPHSSHGAPGTGHSKPSSSVHSALQPSPSSSLPSSHSSPAPTSPSLHGSIWTGVPPSPVSPPSGMFTVPPLELPPLPPLPLP